MSADGGGVKHDTGKPAWQLLPFDALNDVAAVLTYGAAKYTQTGECTCREDTRRDASTVSDAATAQPAETPMSASCERATQHSPKDSRKTHASGSVKTKNANVLVTRRSQSVTEQGITGSRSTHTEASSREGANSAEDKAVACVSTTTTKQGPCEGVCASPAMSASGGSRSSTGAREHTSTCASRKVVRRGERNWERGMAWGRLLGAALRHLSAWAQGTERDAESGLPHLAHAACCVLMLLALTKRGVGADDRAVAP